MSYRRQQISACARQKEKVRRGEREGEEVRLKVSAVSWLVKVHSKLRIDRVYNIFYIDLAPYQVMKFAKGFEQ